MIVDTIPLHEISEVYRGDDDVEKLFERLHAFQVGTLRLRDIQKGLSRHGFTHVQTRALFGTPFSTGKERSAACSLQKEDLGTYLLEFHRNEAHPKERFRICRRMRAVTN